MLSKLSALEGLLHESARILRPPPNLTLSQWADRHFYLSAESSNKVGRWRTIAYQREMMDAITDPLIERVTVIKSSRVGFTKGCINAAIGYYIHQDPRSILVVHPTISDGEKYSKTELAPMIRDCPVITGLVGDPKSRNSGNTILVKLFPGGVLRIVGTNTGTGFRGYTVGVCFFDEVDGYEHSAGGEGDPITLGERRAADAADPKFVYGSSPKYKGDSRIEKLWAVSDQRRFHVPCPRCDHGQVLRWGSRDSDFGIKWRKGDPSTAYYLCESCHQPIEHSEKRRMCDQGLWIAGRPEVEGHAGFHIWAAYSYLPQAAWSKLAQEFLEKHENPFQFQSFVNTVLGETWDERYEGPDESGLMLRREDYPIVETVPSSPDGAAIQGAEMAVPPGAAVLVAGVDTQDDRLEVSIEAFGAGEENWKLEYYVLWGDPSGRTVWDELWKVITRPRWMQRGEWDYVRGVSVDTSGHHTQPAYAFCAPRVLLPTPDGGSMRVFAVRGRQGPGPVWPRAASARNLMKCPVWTIQVDTAKEAIYSRLQRVVKPGPGYIHFPKTFERRYFEQLTSEKAVPKPDKSGRVRIRWELKVTGGRNEALDTAVYAYAALCGLRSSGSFDLDAECERVAERAAEIAEEHARLVAGPPDPEPGPPAGPSEGAPRPRRPGWLSQRRNWLR